MGDWVFRAPRWFWSLVSGVPFGVAMAGFFMIQNDGPLAAPAVVGVCAGVFFGFFMGRWQARWIESLRPGLAHLRRDQRSAAARATMRGPVPADPEIRIAANFLTEARREVNKSQRHLRFFFPIAALLSLFLVAESRWWLALTALFIGMTLVQFWSSRQLEKRAALLTGSGDGPASDMSGR